MVVVLAGAATMLLKAAGPVLVGGRELPARLIRLVNCLAPALFAALIVTQAFGGDHAVRVDERAIGLAAGVTAVWLRAPIVVAVVAAAAVTAVARQLT
jgi:branched-subunit amino acid transport protein